MGFNKAYLPSVQDLEKRLEDNRDGTIRWLRKTDAFIGSPESIKWVQELLEQN